MTNHVHLLLTSEAADGCALLMKGIGQLYAQYINKSYARKGYLWEGRFKSCLVQSEEYLLRCHCYIELNPVRPGLVRYPDEYPWSGYAANAKGESNALLSPHDEYLRLGRSPAERQASYRELFASLSDDQIHEIREATNAGYPLGSGRFKQAVSGAVGRRVEKGLPGRPPSGAATDDQLELL